MRPGNLFYASEYNGDGILTLFQYPPKLSSWAAAPFTFSHESSCRWGFCLDQGGLVRGSGGLSRNLGCIRWFSTFEWLSRLCQNLKRRIHEEAQGQVIFQLVAVNTETKLVRVLDAYKF